MSNYIYIPNKYIKELNLNPIQLLVYSRLAAFDVWCGDYGQLAKMFHVGTSTIYRAVRYFDKYGLIYKKNLSVVGTKERVIICVRYTRDERIRELSEAMELFKKGEEILSKYYSKRKRKTDIQDSFDFEGLEIR